MLPPLACLCRLESICRKYLQAIDYERKALPSELLDGEAVYVNVKQYHAILRRRRQRAKAEAENKLLRVRKVCICHRRKKKNRRRKIEQDIDRTCFHSLGFVLFLTEFAFDTSKRHQYAQSRRDYIWGIPVSINAS